VEIGDVKPDKQPLVLEVVDGGRLVAR
jgi:hypothetical protein